MNASALTVSIDLPGWELLWARLSAPSESPAAAQALAEAVRRARNLHGAALSPDDPTVGAIRRAFRAAGTDPTRYRPSSEALLRRVLKGEDLPSIHPLVDLNNALSIELAVPACIMATGTIDPPVVLRAGADGEAMESLRGPFALAGKPLLADAQGPFGTPITDSVRVKILPETREAWCVAYLPAGVVTLEVAANALLRLASDAGIQVGERFGVAS
jgi:DNA/RNA-binding domain of Phe-tRNA-synthetase-like protein